MCAVPPLGSVFVRMLAYIFTCTHHVHKWACVYVRHTLCVHPWGPPSPSPQLVPWGGSPPGPGRWTPWPCGLRGWWCRRASRTRLRASRPRQRKSACGHAGLQAERPGRCGPCSCMDFAKCMKIHCKPAGTAPDHAQHPSTGLVPCPQTCTHLAFQPPTHPNTHSIPAQGMRHAPKHAPILHPNHPRTQTHSIPAQGMHHGASCAMEPHAPWSLMRTGHAPWSLTSMCDFLPQIVSRSESTSFTGHTHTRARGLSAPQTCHAQQHRMMQTSPCDVPRDFMPTKRDSTRSIRPMPLAPPSCGVCEQEHKWLTVLLIGMQSYKKGTPTTPITTPLCCGTLCALLRVSWTNKHNEVSKHWGRSTSIEARVNAAKRPFALWQQNRGTGAAAPRADVLL